MANSHLLIWIYKALYPLLWVLDAAVSALLRGLKADGQDHFHKTMSVLSEEDFMLLMEEGHREGTVDPAERRLIKNVFEFDDSTVSEVMTPIWQAFMVSATAKITEVLPELRLQKYSRVPVYLKSRTNVVGILYVKDLLALRHNPALGEIDVRSVMTRPIHVGANTRLSVLFRRFKELKTHMAVVDDANEQALGVVTMDDVLESIFGEIADERDVK
jgi:putative hemolysin